MVKGGDSGDRRPIYWVGGLGVKVVREGGARPQAELESGGQVFYLSSHVNSIS